MPAIDMGDHETQDAAELFFGHGIFERGISFVEDPVHAIFWRIPVQARVPGFQGAPEDAVILPEIGYGIFPVRMEMPFRVEGKEKKGKREKGSWSDHFDKVIWIQRHSSPAP